MPAIDLADVQRELVAHGFAEREGTLSDVWLSSVRLQTWKLAPQKGGANVSRLRPMGQAQAPSRSLSARYGLDAQPLHTDGAHLKRVPDVIVLHAPTPNATATVVWQLGREYPSSLTSGVFTVHGNDGSFLARAFDGVKLRFDPVCMSPADHLAKEAKTFLERVRDDAHTHHWSQGGTLLFIDNKRSLHARDAVLANGDKEARVLERAAYTLERS